MEVLACCRKVFVVRQPYENWLSSHWSVIFSISINILCSPQIGFNKLLAWPHLSLPYWPVFRPSCKHKARKQQKFLIMDVSFTQSCLQTMDEKMKGNSSVLTRCCFVTSLLEIDGICKNGLVGTTPYLCISFQYLSTLLIHFTCNFPPIFYTSLSHLNSFSPCVQHLQSDGYMVIGEVVCASLTWQEFCEESLTIFGALSRIVNVVFVLHFSSCIYLVVIYWKWATLVESHLNVSCGKTSF